MKKELKINNINSRLPLREIVHKQLVEAIVNGRINPGEKLLESELAERFNVSRTPIREALLQMQKEGYIILRKNVGAIVTKLSIQKVREIFDIVALLESYAIRLAVRGRINEKNIAFLKSLQEKMEYLVEKENYIEYVRHNVQFHLYIVKSSGNETLSEIVNDLRKKIYSLVSSGTTLPGNADRHIEYHRRIIRAISARDSVGAGKILRSHVEDVASILLKVMIELNA